MSEELLITGLHKANGLAFKEIFKLYYHPLCMYAYRYVQDDTITDDFVQDAFLNLWERRRVSCVECYSLLSLSECAECLFELAETFSREAEK